MYCNLKIIISKQNTLQCVIIKDDLTQENVQIKQNVNEYIPNICIENNNINFSVKETKENKKENKIINFLQDLFDDPTNYMLYNVTYKNSHYEVVFEVLFSLFINEFKTKIEKEYIIERTIVEIETSNHYIIRRIQIALENLELQNIEINHIVFDYLSQGHYFRQILENKTISDNQRKWIERANNFATEEQKEKLKQINQMELSEDEFYLEMVKNFSTKERETMKLCSLDNYCVFIASRYLSTLEDHENLCMVSSRFKNNMEK